MAKISKKKIRTMERQDALGISRKRRRFVLSPRAFTIIKLALIAAIPIVYFVYSPLLIFVMILYAAAFFAAYATENKMNTSVIKSQHIKIAKFDCAIALVVIIIAVCGGFMSLTTKMQKSFKDFAPDDSSFSQSDFFEKMEKRMSTQMALRNLKQFGSCLTGERNVFKTKDKFLFGGENPPPSGEERPNFPGKFSMSDIPLSYISSTTLSTACTVLIFSVAGVGLLSLAGMYYKKSKRNAFMSTTVISGKIALLDDDALNKILHSEKKPNGLTEMRMMLPCKIPCKITVATQLNNRNVRITGLRLVQREKPRLERQGFRVRKGLFRRLFAIKN